MSLQNCVVEVVRALAAHTFQEGLRGRARRRFALGIWLHGPLAKLGQVVKCTGLGCSGSGTKRDQRQTGEATESEPVEGNDENGTPRERCPVRLGVLLREDGTCGRPPVEELFAFLTSR